MQVSQADVIQPGWEVRARDGTEAGTVAEVTATEMLVRVARNRKHAAYVPKRLVIEAHDGLVELDLDREQLDRMAGLEAPSSKAGTQHGAEAPRVAQDVSRPEPPGYERRITGG